MWLAVSSSYIRVRDVETHLISRRIYDAEGQLSSVQFLRRERKAAA
jgi:hypothetical protein